MLYKIILSIIIVQISSCTSIDEKHVSRPVSSIYGGPAVDRLVKYETVEEKDPSHYALIKYEATLELIAKAELSLKKGDSYDAIKYLSVASRYSSYHGKVRNLFTYALQQYIESSKKLFDSIPDCSLVRERAAFLNSVANDHLQSFAKYIVGCGINFGTIDDETERKKFKNQMSVAQLLSISSPLRQDSEEIKILDLDKQIETIISPSRYFPFEQMLKNDVTFLGQFYFELGIPIVSEDVLDGNRVQIYIPFNLTVSELRHDKICSEYKKILERPDYTNNIPCWDGDESIDWSSNANRRHSANNIYISSNVQSIIRHLPLMDEFPLMLEVSIKDNQGATNKLKYEVMPYDGVMDSPKSLVHLRTVVQPLIALKKESSIDCSSLLSRLQVSCLRRKQEPLLTAYRAVNSFSTTLKIYSMKNNDFSFSEQVQSKYNFYAYLTIKADDLQNVRNINIGFDIDGLIDSAFKRYQQI